MITARKNQICLKSCGYSALNLGITLRETKNRIREKTLKRVRESQKGCVKNCGEINPETAQFSFHGHLQAKIEPDAPIIIG